MSRFDLYRSKTSTTVVAKPATASEQEAPPRDVSGASATQNADANGWWQPGRGNVDAALDDLRSRQENIERANKLLGKRSRYRGLREPATDNAVKLERSNTDVAETVVEDTAESPGEEEEEEGGGLFSMFTDFAAKGDHVVCQRMSC